ncbi:hypothetical protein B0H11DRAFT_848563 [Mycena galericulata]|nr:hypothetical protein B0H11DRAFT_2341212 [Mycena galericulata]KAJ7497869.1 hypothetical protein B0H11DRAFT_848563 [Mycena galericulata]
MPSAGDKKYPVIFPPPQEDMNTDINDLLPTMAVISLANISASDDDELARRTLIGLKDYVFDLTEMQKYFEAGQPFCNYAARDISYALTKYSSLPEDAAVIGYESLTVTELSILNDWVAFFLLRFKVVGKLGVVV